MKRVAQMVNQVDFGFGSFFKCARPNSREEVTAALFKSR